MLKVELHAHTSDDPDDYVPHGAEQLIDRLAELGYDALAITLHDKQWDVEPLRPYARARGLVLIPGVEREIDGKHILLINFPARAEQVRTFDEIGALKQDAPSGLVVAPHPFYPLSSCLRGRMDRHADLVDAVEVNAIYSASVDFNRAAIRWALAHDKPIVGNGDVHRLGQLGSTYSLVDAEPDPDAICAAIRAGRVRVETRPFGLLRLAWVMAQILPSGMIGRLQGKGHGNR